LEFLNNFTWFWGIVVFASRSYDVFEDKFSNVGEEKLFYDFGFICLEQ